MGKPGRNHTMTSSLILMLVLISSSITTIGQLRPWPSVLPHGLLLRMDLASRTSTDPASTFAAGRDFSLLTQSPPAAVFRPSTPSDIASLIRFSYSEAPSPFPIAARGQASAPGGVVVEMRALNNFRQQQPPRIRVVAGQSTADPTPGPYVDAGGEQLWVDVLHETLKHGLTPKSWTDYLRLTVGEPSPTPASAGRGEPVPGGGGDGEDENWGFAFSVFRFRAAVLVGLVTHSLMRDNTCSILWSFRVISNCGRVVKPTQVQLEAARPSSSGLTMQIATNHMAEGSVRRAR